MTTFGALLGELLGGAQTTLVVAAGAWVLASVLAAPLAVLGFARFAPAVWCGRVLVTILRSVPQLLVLYLLYFGLAQFNLNIGPVIAAVVGLGITEAGVTAEFYRAGFLTIPDTQREAGASIGLSPLGVLRNVVVPQMTPFVIPPLLNSFVGLLKLATLASAVGAPEILYRGQNYMNNYGHVVEVAAVVIGVYVVVTIPLLRVVAAVERTIRARWA